MVMSSGCAPLPIGTGSAKCARREPARHAPAAWPAAAPRSWPASAPGRRSRGTTLRPMTTSPPAWRPQGGCPRSSAYGAVRRRRRRGAGFTAGTSMNTTSFEANALCGTSGSRATTCDRAHAGLERAGLGIGCRRARRVGNDDLDRVGAATLRGHREVAERHLCHRPARAVPRRTSVSPTRAYGNGCSVVAPARRTRSPVMLGAGSVST